MPINCESQNTYKFKDSVGTTIVEMSKTFDLDLWWPWKLSEMLGHLKIYKVTYLIHLNRLMHS